MTTRGSGRPAYAIHAVGAERRLERRIRRHRPLLLLDRVASCRHDRSGRTWAAATRCLPQQAQRARSVVNRLCDPAVRLHLLVSLTRQADQDLPGTLTAALRHGYTHHQVRALLGLDP